MNATTAALVAAVLTVLNIGISLFNVFYSQRKSDRREVTKWRSDNLLKLTSKLMELSSERQSVLIEALNALNDNRVWPDRPVRTDEKVWQMEPIVAQIRLINDEVAAGAEALYLVHKKCEDDYAAADWDYLELGPTEQIETLTVTELSDLHLNLTNMFRRVSGLPEFTVANRTQETMSIKAKRMLSVINLHRS
jgi:hypothetical protein